MGLKIDAVRVLNSVYTSTETVVGKLTPLTPHPAMCTAPSW